MDKVALMEWLVHLDPEDPLVILEILAHREIKAKEDQLGHREIREILGQSAPVVRWVHQEIEGSQAPRGIQEAQEVLDSEVSKVNLVKLDCQAQLVILEEWDSLVIQVNRDSLVRRDRLVLPVQPEEQDSEVDLDRMVSRECQGHLEIPEQLDTQVRMASEAHRDLLVTQATLVHLVQLDQLDLKDLEALQAPLAFLVW